VGLGLEAPAGASMGGGLSAKNGFCFPSLERLGPGEFIYVYDPNVTATIATITAAYTILRLDAAVGFRAAAAAAASRSFAWRMDMPAMEWGQGQRRREQTRRS
jgi:hypothetical protein